MKKLSAVRLASYAVIIGIAILLQKQIGVIPIHMLGGDELEMWRAAFERQQADRIVVGWSGFQNSKLSGSEVITIALKRARDEGYQGLDTFLPPKIALRVIDGRLVWIVSYDTTGPWPRGFEIKIEDSTGTASYTNTSYVM
jgi:hypothetical protein